MVDQAQIASTTQSVNAVAKLLARHNYVADVGLSTSLFLALKMQKAVFLEGEPDVGKTEKSRC